MTPEYQAALQRAAEIVSAGRQATSTPEERTRADVMVLELKEMILKAAVVALERANQVMKARAWDRQSDLDLEKLRANPYCLEFDARLTRLIEEYE